MAPPFEDAKHKRKSHGGNSRPFDPSKHPRGTGGRFIPTGERLRAAAGKAGQNTVEHVEFGPVRRPGELSKLIGEDVRGFKHAASNQSMRHAVKQHGDPVLEKSRGQKPIDEKDFANLPAIVRSGQYHQADQRPFGPRRVEIHATIAGDRYTYVAEIRRGKRRLDMVTMWKR